MYKVNRLSLIAITGLVVAGCSTQQVSQQAPTAQNSPTAQNAQQSPIVATAAPAPMAVKPVTKPSVRLAKVQPVVIKRTPVQVRRSAVVKKPVVSRPAPRVNTIKKPVTTRPAQAQTPWQQRQVAMNRMQSWSMSGRSALRFKADAWTFGLNWVQRNRQQYSLQIKHPITGTIIGILDQTPGSATLKSRGKVSTGPDAERLLQQQLGVKMPVNGMPYWIRGVMAPQYPVGQVTFIANGRPKQIIQAGWVIEYANYKGAGVNALPTRINISRTQEKVNVRILAKQWQTR
jgi:outer membrane lipoprotein LolB